MYNGADKISEEPISLPEVRAESLYLGLGPVPVSRAHCRSSLIKPNSLRIRLFPASSIPSSSLSVIKPSWGSWRSLRYVLQYQLTSSPCEAGDFADQADAFGHTRTSSGTISFAFFNKQIPPPDRLRKSTFIYRFADFGISFPSQFISFICL